MMSRLPHDFSGPVGLLTPAAVTTSGERVGGTGETNHLNSIVFTAAAIDSID